MIQYRQPFRGDYAISLDYGEKFPPLYTDESPHRGIDYLCPMGVEILASADGQVTTVGNLNVGYGKYIKISHADKKETIYAHLSRIDVMYGKKVKKGDVIGLSGSSGNSTGPHLHFEMRINGIPVDPKPYLRSEIDSYPAVYKPTHDVPQFAPVKAGMCVVVCDSANVRCHCDMNKVMGQIEKGRVISVDETVTEWNGLPYRTYYDTRFQCFLRIAEHDPEVQIIQNV